MYAGHFDFSRALLQELPGLYRPDECRALLAGIGGVEWLAATVNTNQGRAVNDRLRNSLTAVLRDPTIADDLWARVRDRVPATMTAEWDGGRRQVRAIGVHVPVRIYRYEVGHHFGLHNDQSYQGEDGARSLLTLLVYLDDEVVGGETDFPEQGVTVTPRAGCGLWFQHMLLHAGRRVERGVKHVLRSDVLYAP
jgi:hypothetical protein